MNVYRIYNKDKKKYLPRIYPSLAGARLKSAYMTESIRENHEIHECYLEDYHKILPMSTGPTVQDPYYICTVCGSSPWKDNDEAGPDYRVCLTCHPGYMKILEGGDI